MIDFGCPLHRLRPDVWAFFAIEADPRQASAIRHIVCDLIKTKLTLVDSIAGAVDALATQTPELILLPPIISSADEAELRRALGRLPSAAHVEMHATPMLETPGQTTNAAEQARGGRPAGLAETNIDPDVQAFAERVSSCLERARRHQPDSEPPARPRPASRRDASPGHATAPAKTTAAHTPCRGGTCASPDRSMDSDAARSTRRCGFRMSARAAASSTPFTATKATAR